mmetsp:Transcript_2120/g.4620  ORF Transcript_2120/g.4620 Transcript_2120/m.4620 type:complete len:595 (+) Transcript_2120:146-1930(+)|eukprot:scaffold771_cov170-Amphora_coffeaeformis.AAC.22
MTPPPRCYSRAVLGRRQQPFLCGIVLLLLPAAVQGTITIMDTGERFPSRQDKEYGPLLWNGYQYAGRLQMIDGNMPLCPRSTSDAVPEEKHRLVIPSDGLPVALLAREGSCTTLEKLNYIRQNIEPANLVHYLILDGGDHHHIEGSNNVVERGGPLRTDNNLATEAEVSTATELSSFWNIYHHDKQQELCETDDCLKKRDESIPIHVLHVSFRTEYKLLDYLLHQSDTMREDGGPRLAIDSKINVNRLSDNVALAVAALTLLGACLCSLGLLIHGNRAGWWEPEPQRPPPRRRNQRRLRREQVKEMLPVYRFNGAELEIIPEESEAAMVLDEEGNPRPRVPPLLPEELDCCSICLDEYEKGDRVRVIDPCNHTFHSKCIGRWLVERSATCPLCKHDLYDSDDEESEAAAEDGQQQHLGINTQGLVASADPENAGITHFEFLQQQQQQEREPQDPSRSFWNWVRQRTEETPAVAGVSEAQLPLEQQGEQQPQTEGEPVVTRPTRRRWWQRMLRGGGATEQSLIEPLLNQQEGGEERVIQDVEAPIVEEVAGSEEAMPTQEGPTEGVPAEDTTPTTTVPEASSSETEGSTTVVAAE